MKIKIILFSLFSLLIIPKLCLAMPIGTLLYRTTDNGKMYGLSSDELIEVENGIMKGIMPGHVGIYAGRENGVNYVIEALSIGVVKTPLHKFVNKSLNEELVGARIPKDISDVKRAKAVILARNIAEANLGYDFDFKNQKGPNDGDWTCVGLAEKVYESSNTLNPYDLNSLVYNPDNYGIDITPDGFDNYSVYNNRGDCFSTDKEFSYIAPRKDFRLPFSEKEGGYNAGLIKEGKRYIFLPYTQFLQDSLEDVKVDEVVASSFSDKEVRGDVKESSLVLRWSLINNPISRIKTALNKTKEKAKKITTKISAFFKGEEGNIQEVELKALADNKEIDNKETIKTKKDANSKIRGLKVKIRKKDKEVENEINLEEGKEIKEGEEIKKISLNYEEIISEHSKEPRLKDNDLNYKKINLEDNSKKKYISTSSKFIKDTEEDKYKKENELSNISSEKKEILEDIENRDESSNLVYISKIYTEDNNEFIELYNPNNYAIDLKELGYRLEKARTASNPSILVRIGDDGDAKYPKGTIIPALGYYLLVNNNAREYLKEKADALVLRDNFNLNNKKQSIFLGTGAISSYDDEDVVDLVGYGMEAKYYLGEAPAKEIIDYHFLNRVSYNLDNSSDFNLLLCSDPAAVDAWQEQNESDIPGSEYEDEGDNNEEEDEEDEESEEEMEIIKNGISKLYIQAIGSEDDNDFIKIINRSNYDIDLSKFSIRLEKAVTAENPSILIRIGDMTDAAYPGGTVVKKGESYLIVNDSADDYLLQLADAIVIRDSFIITNSEQSIYLGVNAISSFDDEDIIDLIGFGEEASYFSGENPAPSISEDMILFRQSYTSDNSYDYLLKSKYEYFNLDIPDENNEEEEEEEDEENNQDEEEEDDEDEEEDDDEVDEEDEEEDEEEEQGQYDFPVVEDNYNGEPDYLYDHDTSFKSDDILYLNHFNKCSIGNGNSIIGKWGCGKEIGRYTGSFGDEFSEDLDLNNSSIGFYFKYSSGLPLMNISLGSEEDNLGRLYNI